MSVSVCLIDIFRFYSYIYLSLNFFFILFKYLSLHTVNGNVKNNKNIPSIVQTNCLNRKKRKTIQYDGIPCRVDSDHNSQFESKNCSQC